MISIWSTIQERWQEKTDGSGLAVVRIAVALCVLFEVVNASLSGNVTELIVEPQVNFKYAFFSWLGRPHGLMPYALAWVMAGFAVAVAVGWRTRWTAPLLAAGYAYWFLIDASNYTDHGYLVCLLLILTAWLPSNRWASADAYLGRETQSTVPGWTVELLRAQLILVYTFFGLALLNSDWLNGAPLLAWGETEVENNWLIGAFSGQTALLRGLIWGIPILFLLIGPLLSWRRTRFAAFVVLSLFQVFDHFTFQLGVSPILLTFANLIFFDPVQLRGWGNWFAARLYQLPLAGLAWRGLCQLGWMADACVSWFDDTPVWGNQDTAAPSSVRSTTAANTNKKSTTLIATPAAAPQWVITAWILFQIWMPLRYVTLESNPDWTDLATTFAWRGQHRDKQCELKMFAVTPSQELAWPLSPSEEFPIPMAIFYTEQKLASLGLSEGLLKDLVSGPESTLGERIASLNLSEEEGQRILNNFHTTTTLRLAEHQYEQLVQRPELIRQYAHRIADVLSPLLGERVQVRAELTAKLNHRPAEALIKNSSNLDLSQIPNAFELASHLTKIKSPLPDADVRIASAKEWAETRRIELEENYDIVSAKQPPQRGEPVKLPILSDDDERWFQEKYGMK